MPSVATSVLDWGADAKVAAGQARTAPHSNALRCSALLQVRAKVQAGAVPVHKFVIRKQLTKRPEDYPDAQNQPHVQVAIRRRAASKASGYMPVRGSLGCAACELALFCLHQASPSAQSAAKAGCCRPEAAHPLLRLCRARQCPTSSACAWERTGSLWLAAQGSLCQSGRTTWRSCALRLA